MPTPSPTVTELLQAWGNGVSAALDQLMPAVYEELRRRAQRYLRRERPGQTLQTTGLVHEAEWAMARAWLRRELRPHSTVPSDSP